MEMKKEVNNCLTVNHVHQILKTWDLMFTEQIRGEAQLKVLAIAYHSRLSKNGVSPKQLTFLAGKVTDEARFFPKVADILTARSVYGGQESVSRSLQIAETSSQHDQTPEELELSENLRKLAVRAVDKEIPYGQSVELQQDLLAMRKKFEGRLHVVGK